MTRTTERAVPGRSTRARWGWLAALVLVGVPTLAGGCGRAHLSPYYGQSYAAWFDAQHIQTPTATSEPARRALSTLDAQEAAAISKNYRRTVGGQEAASGQGQMVMIGQSGAGRMEGYTPPPSVPAGQ